MTKILSVICNSIQRTEHCKKMLCLYSSFPMLHNRIHSLFCPPSSALGSSVDEYAAVTNSSDRHSVHVKSWKHALYLVLICTYCLISGQRTVTVHLNSNIIKKRTIPWAIIQWILMILLRVSIFGSLIGWLDMII